MLSKFYDVYWESLPNLNAFSLNARETGKLEAGDPSLGSETDG